MIFNFFQFSPSFLELPIHQSQHESCGRSTQQEESLLLL